MKVLKSFLNDYIDINDIDYQEIADKMVLVGNEYEDVKKISDSTNLVIGHVNEAKKHPNSHKLNICQVDIGGSVNQILCGANNVHTGDNVIVALPGATLPGGIEIKKAMLAGYESNGMICALGELGIESKYLSSEDIEGIHVLPSDAKIGDDALKYLGYDDEVINFELTANRSDLQSMIGMAYEVGAIYNKDVKLPTIDVSETKEDINNSYELDVQTDNCPIYLAKKVVNIEIKESPDFIKTRLMASGIRPINNVVDISNYVMLEYGQPLHFFDADLLGNDIIVRMAKKNELLKTLDNKERILKETDIVIANKNSAVALAGVMGGASTEITNDTKSIIIESAIFNPLFIRQTSKDILRSEASIRYEKGIDPNRTILALKRACYLLSIYANGDIIGGILSHDKIDHNDKNISITLDKINSVLGMNLEISDVTDSLERLKFTYTVKDNTIDVIVPTRRLDVSIKEDLIEEIGRIVGYDKIEGILPTTTIKSGKRSAKQNLIRQIYNRLQGLSLNEVSTYSLLSEEKSDLFTNSYNKVVLLDPMSEERKIMRNSIIPSLLDVWDYNNARNIKDINIFEIGSVYSIDNNEYKEETKVAGLLYGNYLTNNWQNSIIKSDFYITKGIIENLLEFLGLSNRYTFKVENILESYHPNKSAAILVDNEIIGYLGCVHPNVNKKNIYVFEISVDKLMSKKVRGIKVKEIVKYPSVNKDLAFVVKKDVSAGDIISIIKRIGGRYLINLDVFDIYEGENVKDDEKSVAFSLTFQNQTKTMEEEEINKLFNGIINEVETKLNAKLRNN